MRYLFLGLVLIGFASAYAEDNECLKRIGDELKTDSELYLFKKHKKVQELFESNCSDSDFGNTLYSQDAFVYIHEAAHFEDLNLDAKDLDNVDKANPAKNFNLYTVNNEHIGDFQSFAKLPKIKDLVRPYLEKNKPEFLSEESIFMGMHDGYIGAEDSMAADIIQGMATELNGYTHGAVVQSRLLPKLPASIVVNDESGGQHTMANPYVSMPSQIDGMLYFLYNFNLYFNLLKKDHPEIWKEFNSNYNKAYLNKLFGPSIEILKQLDHCSLLNSYDPIRFYIDELKSDDLSILEDILGKEKLGVLICSDNLIKDGIGFLSNATDKKSCE